MKTREVFVVLAGASGLALSCTAQSTSTQRLEFDETVLHTDPVGMAFAPVPAAPSQIMSATLVLYLNQSSLPDELQLFDRATQSWTSTNTLGGSGWQAYPLHMDTSYFDEVSAGLGARLLVNFVHAFQGTMIDYADLTVEYEACLADLDANGFVNGDDYDLFASAFDAADPAADLDANGFVNGDDYDLFASSFESGC
jgi:hypothetical protein